jgi:hypothetical protein
MLLWLLIGAVPVVYLLIFLVDGLLNLVDAEFGGN